MYDQSLNRRDFLRLSVLLAGGAFVAACQEMKLELTSTATMLKSGIRLNGNSAEVWTFRKLVMGSLENPAACQAVLVDNSNTRVGAMLDGPSFSAEVPIRPGSNPLKAVCKYTDEEEDLSNEINFAGRLQQRPTAIINASLSNGRLVLDGTGSLPDELENQPIREYIWSARLDNPSAVIVAGGSGQHEFKGEISGTSLDVELLDVDGEYYFSLRVIDEAGREDVSTAYIVVENGQPRIPDYDHENPAWVEEAIVYGVIPRLFGSPGARAIEDKLDDLADLGINALWLAPINATIDYGYSVTDYFELRDNFGPKEDFFAMVQAAHERGIRVLMDFVPNHTSNEHPYFQDTVQKGQA